MKILLVHAHHEPRSFSSALARRAEAVLQAAGHTVVFNDLYVMGFDPVSDRRNFTSVADRDYLKQQAEEMHATEVGGFAPALEEEIAKLEACDALIFSFPLWWFGLPAILKGWVDRAFPMGRIYGGGKLYENGLGQGRRRAMVLMTTGGGEAAYGGEGFNPPMDAVLAPIHHGIFWFNGFLPLDPFIAWSPVHLEAADREAYLEALDARLRTFFDEEPIQLPPLADFPDYGGDRKGRFMVVVTRRQPVDESYRALVPAELATLRRWKKLGRLLAFSASASEDPGWRGFLHLRASDRTEVEQWLAELPLAQRLSFEIHELARA